MEVDLSLPPRNEIQIIMEVFLFNVINIVSLVGNTMVLLAVYRNCRLRRTTNLYIIALAASDLACAAIEMPFTNGTLITGRWIFGDKVCQLVAFVDVFVTYVSPVTIALTAINRYFRIVQADQFNVVFSPLRSKLYLLFTWLSLLCYIITARSLRWQTFTFVSGYATCILRHLSDLRKIVHYSIFATLYFLIPLAVSSFSYYKVFKVICEHNIIISPNLQASLQGVTITLHEIKLSKSLFIVVASFFMCWVPSWFILITERFSLRTVSRNIQLLVTLSLFLSSTINPFIYAFSNRAFRKEFKKMWSGCQERDIVAPLAEGIEMNRRI